METPHKLRVFTKMLHHEIRWNCGNICSESLLMILEKSWKHVNGINKVFGVLIADSWKALDCLIYNVFIAKLHVYGLELPSLQIKS